MKRKENEDKKDDEEKEKEKEDEKDDDSSDEDYNDLMDDEEDLDDSDVDDDLSDDSDDSSDDSDSDYNTLVVVKSDSDDSDTGTVYDKAAKAAYAYIVISNNMKHIHLNVCGKNSVKSMKCVIHIIIISLIWLTTSMNSQLNLLLLPLIILQEQKNIVRILKLKQKKNMILNQHLNVSIAISNLL